jgi:hypothetical protein
VVMKMGGEEYQSLRRCHPAADRVVEEPESCMSDADASDPFLLLNSCFSPRRQNCAELWRVDRQHMGSHCGGNFKPYGKRMRVVSRKARHRWESAGVRATAKLLRISAKMPVSVLTV